METKQRANTSINQQLKKSQAEEHKDLTWFGKAYIHGAAKIKRFTIKL